MYKTLLLLFGLVNGVIWPITSFAQLQGNWKYAKTCQGDEDLCNSGLNEVTLTFEGNLLGIAYFGTTDEIVTRIIYNALSDSVFFVDDSLEIAYIMSKQKMSKRTDSVVGPVLLESKLEYIDGIQCEALRTQYTDANTIIYHNIWVPVQGDSLAAFWNFPRGLVPMLNPLSSKMPIRSEIILSYGQKTATIEYSLVESTNSPTSSNTLIHDGFKLILK